MPGPVKARRILLCTGVACSYCFVVTVFVFHLWPDLSSCHISTCNRSDPKREHELPKLVQSEKTHGNDLENGTPHSYRKAETSSLVERPHRTSIRNEELSTSGAFLLDLCPKDAPNLIGPLDVRRMTLKQVREQDIVSSHKELLPGGRWSPPYCRSRHKVAVIIPYRDRKSHLNQLLNFLIPIMQRQLVHFRFIVAEQYGSDLFNKGRVMNAAFRVAEKLGVDCVIFHDVDMFPEDDRIPYICPDQPTHLGAYVDVLRYDLWYDYLLGGVVAIRMEQYRRVNGHSNLFWGWGGEDDDLGRRVLANNMSILRPPKKFAMYTMLRHTKRRYAVRHNVDHLLNTTEQRWRDDGLNDTDARWKIATLVQKPLYLHVYVDVGEVPEQWRKKP